MVRGREPRRSVEQKKEVNEIFHFIYIQFETVEHFDGNLLQKIKLWELICQINFAELFNN